MLFPFISFGRRGEIEKKRVRKIIINKLKIENKRKANKMMFATRLEMDSHSSRAAPKYSSFVCLFTEFADAAFGSNE